MDSLLGRMVTAPSAISSWSSTGEILDPQLSEPTQMKCPVWLAFLAAWSRRLPAHGEHATEGSGSDGETRSAPEVHVLFCLVAIVVLLSGAE